MKTQSSVMRESLDKSINIDKLATGNWYASTNDRELTCRSRIATHIANTIMLQNIWAKISSLSNHYARSGLVVSAVSFCLIVTFFCIGAPVELISTDVIIRIFSTASLISHLFSNATYIAGTLDQFQNPDPRTQLERWLTLLGIVTGLAGGIIISLSLPAFTFFTFFSTTTVMTGAFAGLGSRFGGLGRRPLPEKIGLSVAAVIGGTMGFYLTLTGTPIIHITGVISFVTCSSPLITSILFVFLVTSLCMSGADYLSKSLVYWRNTFEREKHHEYEGSFFGALLSIAAMIYFLTHLHLLGSAVIAQEGTKLAVATTIALFAKCFGIDGICSRVGRTLDRFFDKEESVYEKIFKVFMVITGVAGLLVIVDICNKLFHSCTRKELLPLPKPSPKFNPSTLSIDTTLSDESSRSDTPQVSPASQDMEPPSPSYLDYFCLGFCYSSFSQRKIHPPTSKPEENAEHRISHCLNN